jgi:hypothetical protein
LLNAGLSLHRSLQIACVSLQPEHPSRRPVLRPGTGRQPAPGRQPVRSVLNGLLAVLPDTEAQAALLLCCATNLPAVRYPAAAGFACLVLLDAAPQRSPEKLEQQNLKLMIR